MQKMNAGISVLLMLLLMGCAPSTPEVITKVNEVYLFPPPAYLVDCDPPFDSEPDTYGDAYERDPVWKVAFDQCAGKIDKINRWVQDKQSSK